MRDCKECDHWKNERLLEKSRLQRPYGFCYMFREQMPDCQQFVRRIGVTTETSDKDGDAVESLLAQLSQVYSAVRHLVTHAKNTNGHAALASWDRERP